MRSISPKLDAIAGNAVATIVWSATARNIGSITEGKTFQNSEPRDGGGSVDAATASLARAMGSA